MKRDNLPLELGSFEVSPYMSSYLTGGWKRDELILEKVLITAASIEGIFRVGDYDPPSDGKFHLAVPIVFVSIAQLAIIYACIDQGLSEKRGEVYLRQINLKCLKPVNDTDSISLLLTLTSRKRINDFTYYGGLINVQHGRFAGSASFVFPVAKPTPVEAP